MMLLRLAAFFFRKLLSLGFLAGPEAGMFVLGAELLGSSERLKSPSPPCPQLEPRPEVLKSVWVGELLEAPASESSMSWSLHAPL